MKKYSLFIVFFLFLIFSCGKENKENITSLSCLDALASCEFSASRNSSSFITHWIKVRDCSYDYGNCLKTKENSSLCEEECEITYVPSVCESACLAKTSTST